MTFIMKYHNMWCLQGGKRDENLILPVNSSLSVTLNQDEVYYQGGHSHRFCVQSCKQGQGSATVKALSDKQYTVLGRWSRGMAEPLCMHNWLLVNGSREKFNKVKQLWPILRLSKIMTAISALDTVPMDSLISIDYDHGAINWWVHNINTAHACIRGK